MNITQNMTGDPAEWAVVNVISQARHYARTLGKLRCHDDPARAIYSQRVPRQAARLLLKAAASQMLTCDGRNVANSLSTLIHLSADDHAAHAEVWGRIEDIAREQREDAERYMEIEA